MASEKKPSIYSDRSTIGSSDELDEYGVWVKIEPQDLSSIGVKGGEIISSSQQDFDTNFDDEPFDTGLGEFNLPDLEIPDDGADSISEPENFDSFETDTLESLNDIGFDDTNFDDFSIPDDSTPLDESTDLDTSMDLDESISLDESTDFDDNSMSDIGGLDTEGLDIEFTESDAGFNDNQETPFESSGFTEVSMEEFLDDTPESLSEEPAEEELPADELSADELSVDESSMDEPFADELSADELPADELSVDESSMDELFAAKVQGDISTQLLMKIAEELSSIRTELTNLKKEFTTFRTEAPVEDKEKTETVHSGFFNEEEDEKIALTGDELDHILNKEKDDAAHGGFFNEEEDEKIALTGDELDNILNTADFTEEAGEDATEELESDFTFPEAEDDLSSDSFQIAEDPIEESPVEEISIDESPAEFSITDDFTTTLSDQEDSIGIDDQIEMLDDSLDLDEIDQFNATFDNTDIEETVEFDGSLEQLNDSELDDDIKALDEIFVSDELKQLREEGALPMADAPDDTSYLEGDILPIDAGTSEVISDVISEETPAEPDISSQIEENPIQEPSPDILEEISGEFDIDIDFDDEPVDTENELIAIDDEPVDIENELIDIDDEPVDTENELIDTEPSTFFDGIADDSIDQVIPEGFIVDTGDKQIPFDDDPEMEEVSELDDIEIVPLEELAPDGSEEFHEIPEKSFDGSVSGEEIGIPTGLKGELKVVLSYMDQLLESLPEEKIEEFARSEYFDTYKKLFKELGLA